MSDGRPTHYLKGELETVFDQPNARRCARCRHGARRKFSRDQYAPHLCFLVHQVAHISEKLPYGITISNARLQLDYDR